jgi:hypothetical protein
MEDDVSMTEWFMDMTRKDYGRIVRSQAAVQHWKDGKMVSERFYCGTK